MQIDGSLHSVEEVHASVGWLTHEQVSYPEPSDKQDWAPVCPLAQKQRCVVPGTQLCVWVLFFLHSPPAHSSSAAQFDTFQVVPLGAQRYAFPDSHFVSPTEQTCGGAVGAQLIRNNIMLPIHTSKAIESFIIRLLLYHVDL
jgi:hypothetical protein